jgi:FG-GAP repeat
MNRAGQAAIVVAAMVAVAMGVRIGAQSGSTSASGAGSTALAQTAYIKASNPHMGDHLGNGGTLLGDSVALSGDGLTMAVGAPNESSGAKGINGKQDDTSVYSAGAVYVFTRRNTASPWAQQAYVKTSNPQAGAEFGHVVTLSADGNTMAVSAYFEASAAKGINGNQNDDSIPQAGAVYVFTRRGTTWSQQAYIKASNTGEAGTDGNFGDGDQFGFSVSLSDDGNTLAVGANAEDSNGKGINGDQNDNSMQSSGAAYIFVRSGATWTQQAYVKAPNTAPNVQFGYSVALSADGNTFAVSAFDEGGRSRTVINGPNGPFPAGRNGSGAIYVYTRSGSTWTLQSYLKASNAENGDSLGVVVSISDDANTIAGGILDEDCMAAGVNPSSPCDNDIKDDTSVGAAVVFVRQGTQWAQQAFIKPSNPGKEDWFASRLQLSGDGNTLAVAAQLEDSAAQGINGKQDDDSGQEAGAVYLFSRAGTQWAQRSYVKSSNNEAFDEFGSSVALSRDGRTMAVGARGEDSSAKGIDGNQGDNSTKEAGAVYVFTYNPSAAGRTPATR